MSFNLFIRKAPQFVKKSTPVCGNLFHTIFIVIINKEQLEKKDETLKRKSVQHL